MPPNHFESEVESFLEGSHGDRTHIKRADHHTVTPLCGTLLGFGAVPLWPFVFGRRWGCCVVPRVSRVPLVCRAARCAGGRRPAREPSAPRASLGASPRSPARPRHRPRAPQPGRLVPPAPYTPVVPGVLMGAVHRLVARPGPATAHRHRGQALGCCMWSSCGCQSSISHAIPLRVFQVLKSNR